MKNCETVQDMKTEHFDDCMTCVISETGVSLYTENVRKINHKSFQTKNDHKNTGSGK